MRVNVDTNACLRYLLDDLPDQAARAERVINDGTAYLAPEVMAECAFVLEKVYELPREKIAEALNVLIDCMTCDSPSGYRRAVKVFEANDKLDMVDSMLIARKLESGDDVLTFDKDMIKVMNRMS